jgi:uncharacterized protein DUF4412
VNRALLILLLAPVAARAQGTFDGTVVGRMTTPEGKAVVFRVYQLGSRSRQEYEMERGMTMTSIYDATTGEGLMLVPQQRKYMVWNLREMSRAGRAMTQGTGGAGPAPDFSKMKVTRTGRSETIAGISCEHYVFVNTETPDHRPVDICGAPGLGFMGLDGQAGARLPSAAALLRSQNPELARLARAGFFPLSMTFTDSKSQESRWVITQIDRRRPEAALFAPPPGYTKMEMPGRP